MATAERMAELQERLSQFLDALERSDAAAGIALVERWSHPEIEFTSMIGSELQGRTYRGLDELQAWFTELLETFEVRYEDREFRTPSDGVLLCLCTNKVRGRGSGAEIERHIGMVWELEGDLVRRSRSYGSHAEAIAAAEALHA
jgi:hypothetical protein